MIYTDPIEYKGLSDIKENMSTYLDKFKKDHILIFRNANLDFDQQEEVVRVLGDGFGWFPNTSKGLIGRYIEDHAPNVNLTEHNQDETVVGWHIEHPYLNNFIVAGVWNNLIFTTHNEAGKTYFMDTTKVFNKLPEDWKDFLKKSEVYSYSYAYHKAMISCKVIENHWLTNDPVIRYQLHRVEPDYHSLKLFDNREPTEEEKAKWLEIGNWIINEINSNEDLRIVHKWQQGDLVIPDLHRLAHAVTGGFNPKDRKFTGIWTYIKDNEFNQL
jgi:alpha-ketoglutarate-dependent taurine dioxygenase